MIILFGLLMAGAAQADSFDCTQIRAKKFVRCGKAVIQADIPIVEKISLSEIFPNSKILSGDIDQDGINDFIVYATEQDNNGMTDKVVVLKGKSVGGYDNFAKSSSIQYGTANIEFKNQSLYIQFDHNSANESQTEIYQFKYRNGGIFLIGEERISYVPVDETHGSTFRTSTNFLTGEVIKSEITDGKKTKELKERVKRELLSLENFSR
jgi:hypothetical protein